MGVLPECERAESRPRRAEAERRAAGALRRFAPATRPLCRETPAGLSPRSAAGRGVFHAGGADRRRGSTPAGPPAVRDCARSRARGGDARAAPKRGTPGGVTGPGRSERIRTVSPERSSSRQTAAKKSRSAARGRRGINWMIFTCSGSFFLNIQALGKKSTLKGEFFRASGRRFAGSTG